MEIKYESKGGYPNLTITLKTGLQLKFDENERLIEEKVLDLKPPEPKPAWEVAWEGPLGLALQREQFKRIWDRAQKEKARETF